MRNIISSAKVSAIITTHNRPDVLPRALNSVLNQTYHDIELIVVSDGQFESTDNYMRQYQNNKNIIYVKYLKPRGANYARNQGLKTSSGEYVAFLDDDDEWLPDKVKMQVNKFEENKELALVYGGKNIIYTNNGIKYRSIPNPVLKENILLGNFVGTTSCVMVRRDLAIECGMFDENLKALQDYDLWIRLCQKGMPGVISEPLINYYNSFGIRQISDNTDLYENSYNIIEQKYSILYNSLSKRDYNQFQYNKYIGLAQRCHRNGNARKSLHYFIKALGSKRDVKAMIFGCSLLIPYSILLYMRKLKKY